MWIHYFILLFSNVVIRAAVQEYLHGENVGGGAVEWDPAENVHHVVVSLLLFRYSSCIRAVAAWLFCDQSFRCASKPDFLIMKGHMESEFHSVLSHENKVNRGCWKETAEFLVFKPKSYILFWTSQLTLFASVCLCRIVQTIDNARSSLC